MSLSRTPRYPPLPSDLKEQLRAITPSVYHARFRSPTTREDFNLSYYPCLVTLKNGSALDRVYLASEIPWIKLWGRYPNEDRGKYEVLISDVAWVVKSPSRLPASFANELYETGESGMGHTVFTVVFKGVIPWLRSRRAFVTGSAVDFIQYPRGRTPKDVVAVLPHVGKRSISNCVPKYYWCLYSE